MTNVTFVYTFSKLVDLIEHTHAKIFVSAFECQVS